MAEDSKGVGPNAWLVDEMYEQYRANPASVDPTWQRFFANPATESGNGDNPPPTSTKQAENPRPTPTPNVHADGEGEPLKGVPAVIAANMNKSLSVPTATSYRQVPARLLEVNRKVINGYLGRHLGGKVSFTHIIGYAVVQAIKTIKSMSTTYSEGPDGKPRVHRHEHTGLGLAVDIERPDGSRTLMVPCIRDADTLQFAEFHSEYDQMIRKVMSNKLSPDDFAGTTVTLTNPGTIGTLQSVPRLMEGQAAIIGVGAIAFPAEYEGADPAKLAELGVSKVVTISSTYDHRIIQGAESGMFLAKMHDLLLGGDNFYEQIFESIGVPYEAVRWHQDINPADHEASLLAKQIQVRKIVQMYRVRGHLIADLDPLGLQNSGMHAELDPASYGLTIWDLDREFLTDDLHGPEWMQFGDMLGVLRDAYCRSVGIEYMHIQDPEEKEWIQRHVERKPKAFTGEEVAHILERLSAATAFEQFLHARYVGHKRFGIEGAESAIPLIDAVLEAAADDGMGGAVLGMAHRGRLNVLANVMGKSHGQIFREFEGHVDPDTTQGTGDVKYHVGSSSTYVTRAGNEMPIELAANPSHLEAVDGVVIGMVRARQDQGERPGLYAVLPLLIHGDAAFAGQGVVAESLNLSLIPGYRVGGTVHVVINNQVGYTTLPGQSRSSTYATDVAKTVQAPIFHVNGDDPEACVRVARHAFAYRQAFHKDVVIDMVCYRRFGHNEGDDPSYTQPLMYKCIDKHPPVLERYTETLVKRGDITAEQADEAVAKLSGRLQDALETTRAEAPAEPALAKEPEHHVVDGSVLETGVDRRTIDWIHAALNTTPDGFTIHPKLQRQFDSRSEMYESGWVDWGLAEAMALGSLLFERTPVRLSGQDSGRGTFAHRHAVLIDNETGDPYIPLRHLADEQGFFWIYDSALSEYAALGVEYGYSTVRQDALVMWEAQFGDFANGAQIIIDQFIVAGEDKWNQQSGLVMLLPHGYEGQGPEHSSARIERFLTLAAEGNITIATPTTSAQMFHLLRRQVKTGNQRPLVVMTPKSLLRAKSARSTIDELTAGGFRCVIDDPAVDDPSTVGSVVLCAGKIGLEAMEWRNADGASAAIVRVEQLYPWPGEQIADIVARYPNATDLVWLQEEPANMGAWSFVYGRLFADPMPLRAVTRPESGSPACGSISVHRQETDALRAELFNA